MLSAFHPCSTNRPPNHLQYPCHVGKIADKLGQSHTLITADCAIYSKAQEILWYKPAHLDGKLMMRLSCMHLTVAFVVSFGKLYGDSGLLSILVDSDVYALATAHLMLQGQ